MTSLALPDGPGWLDRFLDTLRRGESEDVIRQARVGGDLTGTVGNAQIAAGAVGAQEIARKAVPYNRLAGNPLLSVIGSGGPGPAGGWGSIGLYSPQIAIQKNAAGIIDWDGGWGLVLRQPGAYVITSHVRIQVPGGATEYGAFGLRYGGGIGGGNIWSPDVYIRPIISGGNWYWRLALPWPVMALPPGHPILNQPLHTVFWHGGTGSSAIETYLIEARMLWEW